MQNGMDFRNNGFVGDGPLGTIGAGGPNGNHALQDYQMQLMLLEQQNKKRLLMARQEQNTENRPDGPGGPGYPSPNGSRSGPSPGPSEQMGKRGSPQMGSGAMPQSPLHNGVMPHDRASPNSMNYMGQQMPQEMLQPKMENGMPPMGPGSAMARGPQGQYTTQAAEMQARMRGHMPNGPNMFQAQQPPQAPMMQQSQSQQPAQMGTPQPRNNNMPPPQNPAVANANNRRTASPAPSAAPPTPQQTNKAAPKKKKAAENKVSLTSSCVSACTKRISRNPPKKDLPPVLQHKLLQPRQTRNLRPRRQPLPLSLNILHRSVVQRTKRQHQRQLLMPFPRLHHRTSLAPWMGSILTPWDPWT